MMRRTAPSRHSRKEKLAAEASTVPYGEPAAGHAELAVLLNVEISLVPQGIPIRVSCCTAGEFGDVGSEGLGGELEAFGHGQVGAPEVGDLVGGHVGLEDVDTGGGEVAGVLGQGGDADDAAGVGVGDHLDEPAGVAVDDRAWDVREGQDATVVADPGGGCLLVGHPDGGQGGAGEHDPGQVAVVDLPAGTGEGVVGDDGAVGRGDVHELRVGGDVTGSPDARVRRAQVVVDDDRAVVAGAHVDGVQAESAGDRAAAGRDEHLGRPEFLWAAGGGGGDRDLAGGLVAADRGGYLPADDMYS